MNRNVRDAGFCRSKGHVSTDEERGNRKICDVREATTITGEKKAETK